jgi:hypothetical protein
MNSADTFLAVLGPLPAWLNFLALAVAIVLAAFASFLWFAFFHKTKHHHNRKRRRRDEQRKLNPTLAEIGGLPPVREEKNPDAPTPPP